MARPRKKKGKLEEHHVDERWLVSYSDMVTVLFCLFLVLYAMSSVDQAKFEQLKSSLATGFGVEETTNIDLSDGLIVPPDKVGENGEMLTDSNSLKAVNATEKKAAAAEADDLLTIQREIEAALAAKGLSDTVNFSMDPRGLTIHMSSTNAFFGPNDAQLQPQSIVIMDTIAPPVKASGREVSIEGHTAKLAGIQEVRDWELSTERAVNVLRHLLTAGGLDPLKIAATGFGESRPLSPGTEEVNMVKNRRVDIVVLSQENERVRSFLPEAAKAAL